LAKMLYRAGFPHVYGFLSLPDHALYRASFWRRRERTLLIASKVELKLKELTILPDIRGSWEILSVRRERFRAALDRLAAGLARRLKLLVLGN
jgi:hypothetical protein